MIQVTGSADVERFRSVVTRCLGVYFEDAKLGVLADLLGRRLDALGQTPDVYLTGLDGQAMPGEIGVLAQELTVPETYFFRNGDQLRAFAEAALPDRIVAERPSRRLRILSAGCASGEEAYSLAILVRDMVDPSWDVSILGVDVNPAMVKKARRAKYSRWALRETPAHVQQRWFRPEGREFVLDEALRAAVTFQVRNLLDDDAQLWRPDTYDIVFFRNVLMYFTHEIGRSVIERVRCAMKPGGYLFLGHAETLRGYSDDFHLRHTHQTYYHQRKDRLDLPRPSKTDVASGELVRSVVSAVETSDSWIDAIHRASERIESLSRPLPPRPGSLPPRSTPAWDLGLALELLREERFTEALEMMQRLPPESGHDRDALLLSAALQTHGGQLTEAEATCARLLEVDEFSAGAHYLLALCRESAHDSARALYHDRVAMHLDPSFAMPHLHAGLLARRARDHATAQHELERALLLLQREDRSRLLLFGGGFERETLVALCRTELLGCGGRA
jgi:chemotaxis protein methyltransferase CheR